MTSNWPRADILACVAIVCGVGGCMIGYCVQVATPEIRCQVGLWSEVCQKLDSETGVKSAQASQKILPQAGSIQKINIRVGGSTSMARMTRYLHERVSSYSNNVSISYNQQGSDEGIKELRNKQIDVAGLSRELSDSEKQEGFIAVHVADDPIAVVVGKNNPITDITDTLVTEIFLCKKTDWSSAGGNQGAIKAINRGYVSGTRDMFQKQALNGEEFCGNIKTWPVDETSVILRQLGSNGITFATYSDVVGQSMAKVLKINGLMPNASNYRFHHPLYYVYKSDNPAGAEFLKYINSPEGRKAIEQWEKIKTKTALPN